MLQERLNTLFRLQKFFLIKYPVINIGDSFKVKLIKDSRGLYLSLYINKNSLSLKSKYFDGVKSNDSRLLFKF